MDGMTVLLHPLGAWRDGMAQAEIHRPKAGSGWRIHNLTDASWRRLMYVTRNEPWKPNCARLVGEPKSTGRFWSLRCYVPRPESE